MSIHLPSFMAILMAVGAASVYFAPRSRTADAFFREHSDQGEAPGLKPKAEEGHG